MMTQNNTGFLSSIPPVTKNIIIINLLLWVATIVLQRVNIDLINLLGLHLPWARDFNAFQLVSYMFLHDTHSFSHVFFNMFAVYMFGRVLENVWGPKRFLIFYFVTGIGAGLVQELVWTIQLQDLITAEQEMINMGGQIIPKGEYLNLFVTIGASGAVFGILLAFGMLFPNAPLYIMFIPIPVKAKYFVFFYGLAELLLGVSNSVGDSVAHFAHLGGMLFGFFMIRYWKKKDGNNGKYFY
ncbi:rhomboid family intramembrane serine protease [Massilibacteroides sp.]|uniref:rhomboid family intramembrane serine protease n=1 Tax=Massilibacteroides sp. TaxID=2034766 RepID=UPI00262DDC8F|nr:rhomboid family intramembrane serine protease [Massilibacteroides sp.]MDD4514706.1 rhomboid family intramembrane serine protease [Massilibacteroides sp.]